MDLQIRQFQLGLVDYINQSSLPIEVKRLVIKDILLKVEKASEDLISQLIKEQEVQKTKEQSNEEATI